MDRKLNFLLKPLVVPQTCEGNEVGGTYTPAASTVAAGFSRSATFSGYQKMNGFTPLQLSYHMALKHFKCCVQLFLFLGYPTSTPCDRTPKPNTLLQRSSSTVAGPES